MGISVADNFKHLSKKFLDDRESFDTLADMKAVSDSDIPEGFETYCKATDKRYKFLSTNAVDANTGKWREVEYGGGGTSDYADLENKPQIEGVPLTGNKTAADLGLAKANQIPTVPTKVSQLQNDSGFITNSDLPGVYAGDTAGLVPAAGSDNEGKYLDNDGNWTDPLEDFVQNSGGKVLLDIPANTYSTYTEAFAVVKGVLDNLEINQLASIVLRVNTIYHKFQRTTSDRSNYTFGYQYLNNSGTAGAPTSGEFRISKLDSNPGLHMGLWTLGSNNAVAFEDKSLVSSAQTTIIQLIDTSVSATMIGKINRSDIYDTTEKVVGKWIDGKPIYCKTLTGPITPCVTVGTTVETLINVGASIDTFIDAVGTFITANNFIQIFSSTRNKSNVIQEMRLGLNPNSAAVDAEKNTIKIINSMYAAETTYRITAFYTKTTDAANSYNYADENDYSTSEKIIGKWIDGKTLYQKVIVCDAMVKKNNVWESKTNHNISNVDKWVSVDVIGNASGGTAVSSVYFAMDNSTGQPNGSYLYDYIDSSKLWLYSATDRSTMTFYAILKYTKS